MKKKNNQYWTEQDEALVIDYINSSDQHEKSKIYNKLRPAILKLIQGVYRKYVVIDDRSVENDAKVDVEIHLVQKVIPSFKPTKGTKAYSYFSNSIKHFFWDIRKDQKKESVLESLYQYWDDGEGEIRSEVDKADNSITLLEQNEEYQMLVDKVKRYVSKAMVSVSWNERLLLSAVLELLDQSNYDKYYAAYFILSKTKFKVKYLNTLMYKFGLVPLIHTQYELDDYKKIIEENKKQGVFNVKDILNALQHKHYKDDEEKRYKITDRKANLAKAKAKRLKLKNEKISETAG